MKNGPCVTGHMDQHSVSQNYQTKSGRKRKVNTWEIRKFREEVFYKPCLYRMGEGWKTRLQVILIYHWQNCGIITLLCASTKIMRYILQRMLSLAWQHVPVIPAQGCLDCSIISSKLVWAKQHGFFFLKEYLVMEKLLFLFCKIINQKMLSNWLKADE